MNGDNSDYIKTGLKVGAGIFFLILLLIFIFGWRE